MTFKCNHTFIEKEKISMTMNHFSTNSKAVNYESVTSMKTHFYFLFSRQASNHNSHAGTFRGRWGWWEGEKGVGEALIEAPLVLVAFSTDLYKVRITIGKAMKQFLGKNILMQLNIRNISNALLNSYNHLRWRYIMFCIPGNTPEATPPSCGVHHHLHLHCISGIVY